MVVDEVVEGASAEGTATTDGGSHTPESTTEVTDKPTDTGTEDTSSGSSHGSEEPKIGEDGKPIVKAQAYKPNFKYKVYNEEKEFDETLKSLIKDKKSEDAIRDLVTKAQALDEMKPKYQKASEGYNTVQKELGQNQAFWSQCNRFVREKDFDSLFDLAQIPTQDVLLWVHEKLKQAELPPEQQAIIQQNRQARLRTQQLEQENGNLSSSFANQMAQMKTVELNTVLGRPEVSSVAQSFDKRMKEQGRDTTFQKECVRMGFLLSRETGQDVPAEQAVQEVLARVGGVAPQAQSQTLSPGAGAQGQAAQNPPPVIPNIQGRAQSPARKVVRSLADLKKAAAEMA